MLASHQRLLRIRNVGPAGSVKAALLLAAGIALAACGGGGSDGGTTTQPQPYVLTFNPTTLTGSVAQGNAVSWTVTANLDRMIDGTVNVGIIDTSGVLNAGSVSVTALSATSYRATLSSASTLAAGSYSGSFQVRLCRDTPTTCAQPIAGSPWTLPYQFTVTALSSQRYSVSFAPSTFSGSVTAGGNPQPWSTVATFDRALPANVNLGIVDASGVVAPASVVVTPQGGTSYRVAMNTVNTLGAGRYSGSLQLRACLDSVVTCAQPLPGSPWTLSYSLTAFPSLASVQNQCTSVDAQRTWVRSYMDEAYLWYRDIPAVNPASFSTPTAYFDALLVTTPTASGKPRDEFSFTFDTAAWNALINAGESAGYGMQLAIAGRVIRVVYVEAGSPAAAAGVARGDTITRVNGQSVATASSELLNAALFPTAAGQTYAFTLQPVSGATRDVSLTSAVVTSTPVPTTQVLNVGGARIGYILFNDFLFTAQDQLVAAVNTLRAANIDDLVLDLRYNGGGFLFIAAQLGYMLGGTSTEGKVFERSRYNEKRVTDNSEENAVFDFFPFRVNDNFTIDFGTRLPNLGLRRVFVLTTDDTCSASESVINGLRGVDIEVITLGSTTCGKPYGFTAQDNCGTSYFPIEFQGVNAKGFGDFADGFAPTCAVADDLTRPLGDPNEGMLAAALSRRATGQCPAVTAQTQSVRAIGVAAPFDGRLVRNPVRENKFRVPR